ncbi:MAG: EAL domain-containing protein [Oscillospiraceae bacterium]
MHKWLSNDYIESDKYFSKIFIILTQIVAISLIVYLSGGTSAAFTHLMYIPIILSALYFNVIGAAAAAILGGLLLGPKMPKNVLLHVTQEPVGWLFRLTMFMIVGIMVAILFSRIKVHKKSDLEKSFQHFVTGQPNINMLKLDLEKMITAKRIFSLIGFKIINMDDINRHIGYNIGIESAKLAAELFQSHIDNTVYSIYTNEFAAILPDCGIESAQALGTQFLAKIREPLLVDQFHIELIITGGIVNYPLQIAEPDDLIREMGVALGQNTNGIGLSIYDNNIDQKSKECYDVMCRLLGAIKNDEFYLVYQPKLCLTDNSIIGVEALLRWKYGTEKQINTGEFIKIAEEMGIISEITKWVIKNVIVQIGKWRSEGLSLKVAINISSKDLRNSSVINYLIESIRKSALEPAMIEVELTERSILENEKIVTLLLGLLENEGIKISLDDFGTGYNSLIDLIKIPIDYIKIDKVFIDDIADKKDRALIETIINFSHKTGYKTIAEGVETKEQMALLAAMGCEYVQGYYFSKPLPPEEIPKFILSLAEGSVQETTC